jgi:hypothetical protein
MILDENIINNKPDKNNIMRKLCAVFLSLDEIIDLAISLIPDTNIHE